MPLYLDEIWLSVSPPENAKKVHKMFQGVLSGETGFPEGVTLKATLQVHSKINNKEYTKLWHNCTYIKCIFGLLSQAGDSRSRRSKQTQ